VHYNGIIHRDIKPANLLWSTDRQRVKIADFGVSHFSYAQSLGAAHKSSKKRGKQKQAATGDDREKQLLDPDDIVLLNDTDLSKTAGTPFFLAPEIIVDLVGEGGPDDLRPPPKREIGKAIDIWALGVTLYCLLFGHPPWVAKDAPSTEFVTYGLIVHKDWQPKTYMGLDRIPTGGRYPATPPVRTRSGKEVPQAEGPLVMRLLDSLLQKDAKERIVLSEVKVDSSVMFTIYFF
jgi:SNF1-activating kinase 1